MNFQRGIKYSAFSIFFGPEVLIIWYHLTEALFYRAEHKECFSRVTEFYFKVFQIVEPEGVLRDHLPACLPDVTNVYNTDVINAYDVCLVT